MAEDFYAFESREDLERVSKAVRWVEGRRLSGDQSDERLADPGPGVVSVVIISRRLPSAIFGPTVVEDDDKGPYIGKFVYRNVQAVTKEDEWAAGTRCLVLPNNPEDKLGFGCRYEGKIQEDVPDADRNGYEGWPVVLVGGGSRDQCDCDEGRDVTPAEYAACQTGAARHFDLVVSPSMTGADPKWQDLVGDWELHFATDRWRTSNNEEWKLEQVGGTWRLTGKVTYNNGTTDVTETVVLESADFDCKTGGTFSVSAPVADWPGLQALVLAGRPQPDDFSPNCAERLLVYSDNASWQNCPGVWAVPNLLTYDYGSRFQITEAQAQNTGVQIAVRQVLQERLGSDYQWGPSCYIPAGTGRVEVRASIQGAATILHTPQYQFRPDGICLTYTLVAVDEDGNQVEWYGYDENGVLEANTFPQDPSTNLVVGLHSEVPFVQGQLMTTPAGATLLGDIGTNVGYGLGAIQGVRSSSVILNVTDVPLRLAFLVSAYPMPSDSPLNGSCPGGVWARWAVNLGWHPTWYNGQTWIRAMPIRLPPKCFTGVGAGSGSGSGGCTLSMAVNAPANPPGNYAPGTTITIQAICSGASGSVNYVIDWGDGNTEPVGPTGSVITESHSYAGDGPYLVSVTAADAAGCDAAGSVGTFSFTGTITTSPPILPPPPPPAPGSLVVTLDPASGADDPGTYAHPKDVSVNVSVTGLTGDSAVTVDWGDGSTPSTASGGGGGPYPFNHTYAAAGGPYTITATVIDSFDGNSGTDTLGTYTIT